MYIPAAFKIEERAALHAFVQQHSFATLVTTDAEGRPFATHLPFLLDAEGLKTLLYATVAFYEGVGEERGKFEMGPEYVAQMMRGIVGFEIPLTRLEGKMKLSQNRSETDRRQVVAALNASGRAGDAEVAALMLLSTESEPDLS